MKQALSHLLTDLVSAILFLAVYLASGNVALAAALAIAAGLAQLAAARLRGRPIEPMQWIGLALVAALGGATMLTDSPRFVMLKPSLVHLAIGAAMLRRGWMLRYLPQIVRANLPESVPVAAGYGWAALMAALGLANLGFAVAGSVAAWAWFVSVGALGAKIAAFLLQYAVFRALMRHKLGQHGEVSGADVALPG